MEQPASAALLIPPPQQPPAPPELAVPSGIEIQSSAPGPVGKQIVRAMDPREVFTGLSALHIHEDTVRFFGTSYSYMVSDYSNGYQGRPLFSGSMENCFFGSLGSSRMSLFCLAITDQSRKPARFLEVGKNGLEGNFAVSYVFGPQPMFLGLITGQFSWWGTTMNVVDTVTKRMLYCIKSTENCCGTYEFAIVDPVNADIGGIHIVTSLCKSR